MQSCVRQLLRQLLPRIDQVPKALRYLSLNIQPANESQVDDPLFALRVVREWLMLTADTIKVVEIYTKTKNGQRSWWTVRKFDECHGLDGPGPVRWGTCKVVKRLVREEALALKQEYTYVLPLSARVMVSEH